jgi:hypothetical protein
LSLLVLLRLHVSAVFRGAYFLLYHLIAFGPAVVGCAGRAGAALVTEAEVNFPEPGSITGAGGTFLDNGGVGSGILATFAASATGTPGCTTDPPVTLESLDDSPSDAMLPASPSPPVMPTNPASACTHPGNTMW